MNATLKNPASNASAHIEEINSMLLEARDSVEHVARTLPEIKRGIKEMEAEHESLEAWLPRLRAGSIFPGRHMSVPAHRRKVTCECAEWIASVTIHGAMQRNQLRNLPKHRVRALNERIDAVVGLEQRAALTSSDIPLPAIYSREVIELVNQYGGARKYCQIMPLPRRLQLPRLKTSPGFGFIDMSATIPEKVPQIEFVNFPPEKAGGIVRFPTEIEEDSLVNLGMFIADYIARETARFEDRLAFEADGSATWKSFKSVGKFAVDAGRHVQITGGTLPGDIDLPDVRAMRGKVASAALLNGAYYFHPTMEIVLRGFNNLTNGTVFKDEGPNGPTLDNFPVRWIETLPPFDTVAAADQIQGVFGDLSYFHLGVHPRMLLDFSRDVFFATDELAVRGIERVASAQMDEGAASAIQLASS